MRFPDRICQTNDKLLVMVNTNNACKLVSDNHLWLIFFDQP